MSAELGDDQRLEMETHTRIGPGYRADLRDEEPDPTPTITPRPTVRPTPTDDDDDDRDDDDDDDDDDDEPESRDSVVSRDSGGSADSVD